jgi:molybdate transport system substrate-binding protein
LKNVIPNVIVFAKSCSDTAMLAVLKKVDAIIGWDVFATWNPRNVECIRIRPEKIPRIAYIAIAVPIFVKNRNAADNFIQYILSPKGLGIFKKWGYFTDLESAKKYALKASVGGEYKLPDDYFKTINYER